MRIILSSRQTLLFFFSFFSNLFSFNDLLGSFLLSFLASLSFPMAYELKMIDKKYRTTKVKKNSIKKTRGKIIIESTPFLKM